MEEEFKELLKGNMDYFDSFYEQTKRKIYYNIFAILKNRELSEDALQETYLRFLTNLPSLKEEKNVLGYLFVISRNIALDILKKQKRHVDIQEFENTPLFQVNEEYEDDALLKKVKEILNDKEYEIVILHLVNNLTHKEIAKLMHRPLGTVLWAYNNAIKKLKKGIDINA